MPASPGSTAQAAPAVVGNGPAAGPVGLPAHPKLDGHRGAADRRAGWPAGRAAAPGVADRTRDRHRRAPVRAHPGAYWDKPATADTARRALAEGIPACPQCRPDTAMGMLE
ncbi:DUF6233 domain-containing protein [Streptomyces sp. NPDC127112]|uniref:DUF6233 domain-containing protein n=1 Tax=Streptomyces sp. NPDC127112 TaxID=3345364 RepID=UPI003637FD5B